MFKRIIAAMLFVIVSPFSAAATIPIIVTAGPGTTSDHTARTIANLYNEKKTGHTLIVENIPGGRTIPAANRFLNSKKPAILMGATSLHVVNPALFSSETPYEGVKEFDFIGGMVYNPILLYSSSQHKLNNLEAFVTYVRKQPREVLLGTDTLNGEINAKAIIRKYRLTNVTIIKYKTSIDTLRDVLGGTLDFAHSATSPLSMTYASEGRINIIGSTWKETLITHGISIPSLNMDLIDGVATLSLNTKIVNFDDIDVAKLKRDLLSIQQDPRFIEKVKLAGSIYAEMPAAEVPKWIQNKINFVKEIGL